MNKKKTIAIIIFTALITCLLTNTIRDIVDVQNNGLVRNKVKNVAKIIDNYSLYDVDEEKMADYAASAIAYSVDDHYTNYYNKEQFKSYQNNISNSFYGIGIVISVDADANKLVVVSPVEGGPASNAGILAGDFIVAVDDKPYTAEQMSEAVSVMRGDNIENKEGTQVKVTVERNNEKKDFTITRDVIKSDSVKGKMIDDKIGYIRITAFNSKNPEEEDAKDTYDEFKESLTSLQDSNMQKLIIDLRNNPGGSLEVVNKIADELLPEGIITYTEDKNGKRQDYYSKTGDLNIPVVVLVNEGSASASEVLTGALKDYKKATIVGTKTFGKGIVQTVIPMNDGSGISVTTSKYFSPNGVCIHGIGIEPDVVVETKESTNILNLTLEEDIQLQKAIEILSK